MKVAPSDISNYLPFNNSFKVSLLLIYPAPCSLSMLYSRISCIFHLYPVCPCQRPGQPWPPTQWHTRRSQPMVSLFILFPETYWDSCPGESFIVSFTGCVDGVLLVTPWASGAQDQCDRNLPIRWCTAISVILLTMHTFYSTCHLCL